MTAEQAVCLISSLITAAREVSHINKLRVLIFKFSSFFYSFQRTREKLNKEKQSMVGTKKFGIYWNNSILTKYIVSITRNTASLMKSCCQGDLRKLYHFKLFLFKSHFPYHCFEMQCNLQNYFLYRNGCMYLQWCQHFKKYEWMRWYNRGILSLCKQSSHHKTSRCHRISAYSDVNLCSQNRRSIFEALPNKFVAHQIH